MIQEIRDQSKKFRLRMHFFPVPLSAKINQLPLHLDSCEILLRFIIRPPEVEEDSTKILNSDEYILSSNRRRDALLAEAEPERREGETSEEEEELQFSVEAKRADKAAEVFVYQTSYFPDEFFEENLEKLGKCFKLLFFFLSLFASNP